MNDTVLTQDDWLVVGNTLSMWTSDSMFLDITGDFTASGTCLFVLRLNDATYASALTLGVTSSLTEAIALANDFLKREKEVSTMAYKWRYQVKGWGAVLQEGDAATDTREDILARRDKLVTLLRESDWYAEQPDGEDSALAQRVRELEAADDDCEADNLLMAIYDLADIERAWLDPFE